MKDLVFQIIKTKYSNITAKNTKTLKQIQRFISENKQLSEIQKKQLKETINRIWNRIYSNTKSEYAANLFITALAFKLGILHNSNYKNTFNYKYMQNIINTFKFV